MDNGPVLYDFLKMGHFLLFSLLDDEAAVHSRGSGMILGHKEAETQRKIIRNSSFVGVAKKNV